MSLVNNLKSDEVTAVFELLPPRENPLDALAIETLLGSLDLESAFSLEISGDQRGRHFLIRSEQHQIGYLQAQLQSAYDQIAFRGVSPELDPARDDSGTVRATAQLTLRRPSICRFAPIAMANSRVRIQSAAFWVP